VLQEEKMALIVQKYGGSSVNSLDRIRVVAKRIQKTREHNQVVVVVSAMGDSTDDLVALAQPLVSQPLTPAQSREWDMLLSSGEQVSIALVALALQQLGCPAVSLLGSQVGIRTTPEHTRARILDISPHRIRQHLQEGEVVVVAGFQGISHPSGLTDFTDLQITTLGRGGSDTTAVALAVALQADACEIYTDVLGVYTTDPRKVPEARLIPEITSAEMLELASLGAQVLHPRSVEIARNFGIPIKVLSSFQDPSISQSGTVVVSPDPINRSLSAIETAQSVNCVELDQNQVMVVLLQVPDRPGIAAHLFKSVSTAGINVDLILQSIHTDPDGNSNDIAFTISREGLSPLKEILTTIAEQLNCPQVYLDEQVAKVSLGGAGMIGRPGIAADMFQVLAEAGINILMISMSEVKVSCLIKSEQASEAVLRLGEHFQIIPQTHRKASRILSGVKPVSGVALDSKQVRLAIRHVPDRPGSASLIFQKLAQAGIQVDTIIQSQRYQENQNGIPTNDIVFTVSAEQKPLAEQVLQHELTALPGAHLIPSKAIAKVSIVGAEMEFYPGIAAQMFQTLADLGINIEMISTSEIKVSCAVDPATGLKALQGIHRAFELDQGSSPKEGFL
jgi:aspartate kinase